MEETFGLLHKANREFFISVVGRLADQDYGVRWKVMNFGEYGVPQDRRRVVLIASGYVHRPIGSHLPPSLNISTKRRSPYSPSNRSWRPTSRR